MAMRDTIFAGMQQRAERLHIVFVQRLAPNIYCIANQTINVTPDCDTS